MKSCKILFFEKAFTRPQQEENPFGLIPSHLCLNILQMQNRRYKGNSVNENMQHYIKTILFLAVLCLSPLARGQESKIYNHDQRAYQEALALYNNGQYQAAQTLFDKVLKTTEDQETKANSAYYIANAAVRLNQRGADQLMEEFVENYPTSTKRNSAYLDVANYYFANGKYSYALKWYEQVDQSAMARSEREDFNFRMGYSLFATDRPAEARRYLTPLATSQEYGSQAKYYLGYMAYEEDDFEGANERFDQITDQEVLKDKLAYYQADMNFKLGRFEQAIAEAKQYLPKADRQEASELNKIIGESYFNLGQYENAIPYLKEYRGKRGKWSNTDYYLLGYSYYKSGDNENAISQFNKIIGGSNAVSQNAYYHLADAYLKAGRKQEALNAFKNAAEMDFNEEISKDAYLNYARLSYELGNAYETVPKVIATYIERYPGDPQVEEMKSLLVDSYLTSRNFKGAMELLQQNREYASRETYQKVAFYRGMELFQEGDYAEAYDHLQIASSLNADAIFGARATFWKGEAAYRLNRYEDALAAYGAFQDDPAAKRLDLYESLDYQVGYAHFKQKQYQQAASAFERFVRNSATGAEAYDAYARLGDSYFATRQYWPAMESYNKVIASASSEKDYAAFQKAVSYGFVDRNSTKIEELERFLDTYPGSTLQDDVLFELANTYVSLGREQEGLRAYDRIVREYPGSSLVPQALLRQGLVNYNAGNNEAALQKFRSVVNQYENSQEAVQAVTTAKLIYVDLGRVDEYAQWVQQLDFVEVSNAELDNTTYESAERQQLEGRTAAAIRGYEQYLAQFPNGLHKQEAHFNLAELRYSQGEKEASLAHYQRVADAGLNENSEKALTRVSDILLSQGKTEEAMAYLQRLEEVAEVKENRIFAKSNLMKGYYDRKDFQTTLRYANELLNTPGVDARIQNDARLMVARSAMATGNEEKAIQTYRELIQTASGEVAAEARYYDARALHAAGNFEASNAKVQELVKAYAAYKNWSGKGLILMAKNYDALDDAYQATYILESVIQNFSGYPDIIQSAEQELTRIKSREAESNSSIDINN